MKRSWFGFALLVALLAASLTVTWAMEEIHRPVARQLRLAAGCALSEDWDSARTLAEEAAGEWKKWDGLRRCFADHSPVEEIEAGLARLGAYGRQEETAEFAAACKELAKQVDAMGMAHGLSLWNLL